MNGLSLLTGFSETIHQRPQWMQGSDMAETRKCQIVLLDNTTLSFSIHVKMYTNDLFNIVASHFSLKEKEYFGLYYLDDMGNQMWLQSDRKVLDHELPRKTDPTFYFAVRFYVENVCYLHDTVSVELFYLQARQSVFQGAIECDSTTAFELAAYALLVANDNLTDDIPALREALKKLPVFPTATLREHPSIQYCEDQVLKIYFTMLGNTRGQAIISYMSLVEKLPTYGIHYYEVKNKQGIPWWLGLSFKGIAQFDYNDKRTPRRVFPWKYLENLYFRDKKFSIEVHDPKRVVLALSSFNLYEDAIREPFEECDDLSDAITDPTTQVSVSRRAFGPSNVNVYAWFTNRPQFTKSIWSMAVCQHQFFLDRQQNKNTMMIKRCPNALADELSMSSSSLLSLQSMTSSSSTLQNSALSSLGMDHSKRVKHISRSKIELSPEQKALQLELYKGLAEKKKSLETVLSERIKELKELCMQEAQITGKLPSEYMLCMDPGEKLPAVKKRMGTAFSIAEHVMGPNSDVLSKLEMEYEVQKQIKMAKQKLANDESLPKNVRKKHKQAHQETIVKLKELEERLKVIRIQSGLDAGSFTSEDTASLGSTPSIGKSPKKSASSQQLEALEHSPMSRRRLNSASRMQSKPSSRSLNAPSNPSSTSSLNSLSHNEGWSEFTPTKALKFKPPVTKSQMPVNHSAAELDSVGSSTNNSSSSSLHAYSVSGGRPLRSGSMDDVRIGDGPNGAPVTSPRHTVDQQGEGNSQRSKGYLANNPYGSLERKALKQRRAARNGEAAMLSNPPLPPPNMCNPYTHRGDYSDPYSQPSGYRLLHDYKPTQDMHVSRRPQFQARHSHEKDLAPQPASLRIYSSSPQPFQMLENPYVPRHREHESLRRNSSESRITPIIIESQTDKRDSVTDSSSCHSSPKECAFNFFNNLPGIVQMEQRLPSSNPYKSNQTEDLNRLRFAQLAEESKPYETNDFYKYSERLRRARGEAVPSPRPSDIESLRSSSRPSSTSGRSLDGSRPASPFTTVSGHTVSRQSQNLQPMGHNSINAVNGQNYPMHASHSSIHLKPPAYPPRRSTSMNTIQDSSFDTGDLADNFSQEMLAWYEDKDAEQVPSTLV